MYKPKLLLLLASPGKLALEEREKDVSPVDSDASVCIAEVDTADVTEDDFFCSAHTALTDGRSI